MNRSPRFQNTAVPLALEWSHAESTYRATPWPEVRFERQYGDEWMQVSPSTEIIVAAARAIPSSAWFAFLEFAPVHVREFAGLFRRHRLHALHVAARCPELVATLADAPTLTAFVAMHASASWGGRDRWDELNAMFERGGVYALLEGLGLPASPQTLAILRNVVAPDLAEHLLEPLRAVLWQPQGIFALARLPEITESELAQTCHVLAA